MTNTMERDSYLGGNMLDKIEHLLPDERTLRELSEFYSVFSDVTRIRIISALAVSEMCVGDLANLLSSHQSTVSHQLHYLLSSGIVNYRRSGKMIFYYIDNLLVDEVMSLGIENITSNVKGKY